MTPEDRFWSKVDTAGECWTWTAGRARNGYGTFSLNSKSVKAHRYAYEITIGPVPDGMELDHLCRNRGCVRPDHLEAVSRRVNALRGESFSARNAAVTHCPQGHEYTPENTLTHTTGRFYRSCRTCNRERSRERSSTSCPRCGSRQHSSNMARHIRRMH